MATTKTETRRLFFACWPGARLQQRIAALLPPAIRQHGRAVPSEKLHITLVFLGTVDIDAQHCLEETATGIGGTAFTLRLDTLGHWRRSQVYWLGPSQTSLALAQLVAALNRAARACGLSTESRPYKAHLTLARKLRRPPPVAPTPPPIEWRVDRFALVESRNEDGGTRYLPLRWWPLTSP